MFHEYKVDLSDGQQKTLAAALKKKAATTIKLDKNHLVGEYPLMLTQRQLGQIAKARETGKGLMLNLSAKQIGKMHQMVSGGFLPALLPLLGMLGPAVATGALSGLAGWGVNKAINAIEGKGAANPPKTANGQLKKKPVNRPRPLNQKEISATGLFQYGVPYSRGAGLVPLGM